MTQILISRAQITYLLFLFYNFYMEAQLPFKIAANVDSIIITKWELYKASGLKRKRMLHRLHIRLNIKEIIEDFKIKRIHEKPNGSQNSTRRV